MRRYLLALVPSRLWMRMAWERRARENAEHYVADFRKEWSSKEDFFASGQQDVERFLADAGWVGTETCQLLEIGCGVGRMTKFFAERFRQVDALDISPTMIRKAREALDGAPNITFHVGSGVDLKEFPDATFDYVVSYIVFQHIPRERVIYNYVEEALRVLKPEGCFRFQARNDATPRLISAYKGVSIDIEQIRCIAGRHNRKIVHLSGEKTNKCFIEIGAFDPSRGNQ